jgi:hypothetical protein
MNHDSTVLNGIGVGVEEAKIHKAFFHPSQSGFALTGGWELGHHAVLCYRAIRPLGRKRKKEA